MPQLNAFVGHSFAEGDKVVVGRLLALLDSLEAVMPEFVWDSAEAAEAKVLSAKVREKMKGKNVFIGICTAREQAVQAAQTPGFFVSLFLGKSQFVVEQALVETKTADWIIQEIGYAVASDMDLILLLEDGVRKPGGLQGDLEYIPFSRGEPEKCLEKLASMLGNLSPKPKPAVESPEKATTGESAEEPGPDAFLQSFLIPDSSWTLDIYVSRYRVSIRLDKPEFQEKIFEAARISQRAFVYREDWLTPLQKLVTEHPTCVGPYLALGERFAAVGEYERAAQSFQEAANHSTKTENKIYRLILAGGQYAKAKQSETAEELLRVAGELARTNPAYEADALGEMSDVWMELGNADLFLACAERCLELAPDKTEPRFALAHKYSDLDFDAEALFHYRQYLVAKDDPGGWNNLGVAAAALRLPVTAVDGYVRADEQGNTLATSNLAFAKLGAGFADEATELCNRGMRAAEFNPRLLDALVKCKRAREDETKRESELLDATKVRREVFRAMGKASLQATPRRLHHAWQGSLCQLIASFDGSQVKMTGTYERKGNTLGGLMSGFLADKSETVTLEYIGKFHGEAFVGKIKTSTPSAVVGLLSPDREGSDCVGFLEASGTMLTILEGKNRYVLTAIFGDVSKNPQ
jgi:tetratricopeptide (TPR) repeat protein